MDTLITGYISVSSSLQLEKQLKAHRLPAGQKPHVNLKLGSFKMRVTLEIIDKKIQWTFSTIKIWVAYNKIHMLKQFPCKVYFSHNLHEEPYKRYTVGSGKVITCHALTTFTSIRNYRRVLWRKDLGTLLGLCRSSGKHDNIFLILRWLV